MNKLRLLPSLLLASAALTFSPAATLAQAAFPSTSMKATVGANGLSGTKSTGTLTLSSSGANFDSPDFVFTLPADDIQAVEPHGARAGFLTLVIDSHSKFLAAYPPLITQRSNSIGEQEHLLVLSLPAPEPVNVELTHAEAFQAFIKSHRAEREQLIVGASGGDTTSAAHPSFGKTLHVAVGEAYGALDGLLTFFPDRLQFVSPDVTISFPVDQLVELDPAGARETFLMVHSNPRSKIASAYQKYERGYQTGDFLFILPPQEAIAPAFKQAQDYASYINAVRSGQEQAIVNGGAAAPGGASEAAAAAPSALPASGESKRELARYNAGFLERHNPGSRLLNSFKAINGIPGTLIVFDTGLGYVSTEENPKMNPRVSSLSKAAILSSLSQTRPSSAFTM